MTKQDLIDIIVEALQRSRYLSPNPSHEAVAELILRNFHANGVKVRGPQERPPRIELPTLEGKARKDTGAPKLR